MVHVAHNMTVQVQDLTGRYVVTATPSAELEHRRVGVANVYVGSAFTPDFSVVGHDGRVTLDGFSDIDSAMSAAVEMATRQAIECTREAYARVRARSAQPIITTGGNVITPPRQVGDRVVSKVSGLRGAVLEVREGGALVEVDGDGGRVFMPTSNMRAERTTPPTRDADTMGGAS